VKIRFDKVTKRFGSHVAIREIDLDVEPGEFLVLLGPSGCGKTTLLRLLAGLERADAGRIWIGDRVVNDVPPAERDVAMVFQNYALYPHFSVFDNIAFPLRARRVGAAEIQRRVCETVARLGLEAVLHHRPAQLSGGQQQRVALARAIVRAPLAFLMDEPLSNLDAQLRTHTRAELKRLQQELGTTTIYVTHDQGEAMTLGNRVALLRQGAIEQLGRPMALYREPANAYVARFIGSPPINLWQGELGAGPHVCVAGLEVAIGSELRAKLQRASRVQVGLRPEDIVLATAGAPGCAQGRVLVVEPMGNETLVTLERDGDRIVARGVPDFYVAAGTPVWFSIVPERALFFDAESGERIC
jgi:ABC-type sugar transport system ATPase subunit